MNTTDDACTLHVFGDDCEWVIAYDRDDAQRVYDDHVGEPGSNRADRWKQESDSAKRTVRLCEDGDQYGDDETLTNAEWATRLGRGYFCTTEA